MSNVERLEDGAWLLFGHVQDRRGETVFIHVHPGLIAVRLCGREPIHRLAVREAGDGDDSAYYGWLPADRDFPSLIYKALVSLNLCFAGGVDRAVELGSGRVVRLTIEDLGALSED